MDSEILRAGGMHEHHCGSHCPEENSYSHSNAPESGSAAVRILKSAATNNTARSEGKYNTKIYQNPRSPEQSCLEDENPA
jgi:hypothetical protein